MIEDLAPLTLSVWPDSEIDTKSKAAMARFAAENKIEIVAVASDHAERAWTRYFNVAPPFNPAEERKNRRKDIPDAWIFETAIDLRQEHAELFALCSDGKLSKAMASIGIKVFKETQQVLDLIDKPPAPEPAAKAGEVAIATQAPAEATVEGAEGRLDAVLADAAERFKGLDTKILGYVGYLGSPSKDQLFGLLSQSGVSPDVAHNVAERLAIEGLIEDTGNHYLPTNREACTLAAPLVEFEIIKLLDS